MTAEDRFWSHVAKDDPGGCWLWWGARNEHGYGRTEWQGRSMLSHRLAFELTHGREPVGLVLHRCDVPACVNPAHLVEGTQTDNMRDCIAKGRFKRLPIVRKTHCPRGHAYDVHGRWRKDRNHPICRICEKRSDRAKYVRKRQAEGKPLRDPPEVMRTKTGVRVSA